MFYIKDEDIQFHWVVHLKTNPVDVDEFFKRKPFNDETDFQIKLTSIQVYQDDNLKGNDQTEDPSVMSEQQYKKRNIRNGV